MAALVIAMVSGYSPRDLFEMVGLFSRGIKNASLSALPKDGNPAGLRDLVLQSLQAPPGEASFEALAAQRIQLAVIIAVGGGSEPDLGSLKLVTAEVGSGGFGGRRLPAALALFQIEGVNRLEGKHTSGSFIVGAIHDKEFKLWRNISSWPAQTPETLAANDEFNALVGVPAWKSAVTFSRDAGSAELPLAPQRVESSQPPTGIGKSGEASSNASVDGPGPKSALKDECAAYEPAVTVAQGILRRKTFPGPPNYEDVAKGDEPETGFYLELAKPLCVRGEEGEEAGYGPIEDVSLLQLILDKDGYDRLREHLDQPVTISGGLSPGFSGHHHAPLLLQPK